MPKEGNFPSCASDQEKSDVLPSPPKEKCKEKLVRIGSRYFSKDTRTERKFNLGLEEGKAPTGVRFKTLNEVVVDKQCTYKPVNKRLPTYPGEFVTPEDIPLPPVTKSEEEELDLR